MYTQEGSALIRTMSKLFGMLTGGGIAMLFLVRSAYAQLFINPLGPTSTIGGIIGKLTIWLISLAAVLALLSLVVGGIYLILGGFGDEQGVRKGKQIVAWAVIGLAVVILAWTIIWYVATLLGAL